MARSRSKRRKRQNSRSEKNDDNSQTRVAQKRKQLIHSEVIEQHVIASGDHETDEDANPTPEDLQSLLEPYTKEQLISLLADAAVDDSSLLTHILSLADQGIAHRKIYVRGLGWDVTKEILYEAFRPYGPILDCTVAVDKASGNNKGYGFVVFANRAGAFKALKVSEKKIGSRTAFCQLALSGSASNGFTDLAQRRIYVSNVHADVSPEKLKAFFSSFGEIEMGPLGLDPLTGKLRGYAIFVYKTLDGAKKALHGPYKMFEGHQLHCKLAYDNLQKGKSPAIPVAGQNLLAANQQQVLNAIASTQNQTILNQNLAMLNQNPALFSQNPAYSMLLAQNPLLTNSALNPNSIAALNPAALASFNHSASLIAPQGHGYGELGYGGHGYRGQGYSVQGYGGIGLGLGGSTLFGPYGGLESSGLSYGGSQLGQSSSGAQPSSYFGGFRQ